MLYTPHSITTSLAKANSSGLCSIRHRVSCNNQRIDLYSGITIPQNKWKNDRVKQGVVINGMQYFQLNEILTEQKIFIDQFFNNASTREEIISLQELKKQFNYKYKSGNSQGSDEFLYKMNEYIDVRSQTRKWSKAYKQEWQRIANSLKTYDEKVKFTSFNESYMNGYLKMLSNTMSNDKIEKALQKLREFLVWARKRKYPVNDDFFNYEPKLPKADKDVRFLNINEVNQLIDLELENGSCMDRTRDYFLFQCFTSLRYSDVSKITAENIVKNENGDYYLDIYTTKDKDRIRIPLLDNAVAIYKKYKDNIYPKNTLFGMPSNQKYNENLKRLGKILNLKGEWISHRYKLDEMITIKKPKTDLESHDARRTFIVIAANHGIGREEIAKITGHDHIEDMDPYVEIVDKGRENVMNKMNELFKKR